MTTYDKIQAAVLSFFGAGAAAVVTAVSTGYVTYLLVERDCSGEYMCGLGAFVIAAVLAAGLALMVFIVAAVLLLQRALPVGERFWPAVAVFASPASLLLITVASAAGWT